MADALSMQHPNFSFLFLVFYLVLQFLLFFSSVPFFFFFFFSVGHEAQGAFSLSTVYVHTLNKRQQREVHRK
jgi:hypothetical protein